MFSKGDSNTGSSPSQGRGWKLIYLGLTLAVVVSVVTLHEPTRSAAKRVLVKLKTDQTCPQSSSLAGTWVKAASAPSACVVTQAVVTSEGACRFKIEMNVNGQPDTTFAVLHEDGTLVEEGQGNHHGQLFLNANPPVLKLGDGCSYVEQTFGAIKKFDGGEYHPSCSDKLLHGKDGLIADDAKLWWGKKSEGGIALTEEILNQFRRGLKFDARTWTRGEGSNLIISDDNRAVRVDEKKCQVTDVYIPLATGELNERIDDDVKRDPKAKCQRELWHKLRKIYRSEIGKTDAQKEKELIDDLITLMPRSRKSKVFYVDGDGLLKSTSPRQAQRDGLLKGSTFRLMHVRVDLLPDHPLKDKVAFLFANNMVVLGDFDPCQISGVYLPTVDGGVSLKLEV